MTEVLRVLIIVAVNKNFKEVFTLLAICAKSESICNNNNLSYYISSLTEIMDYRFL